MKVNILISSPWPLEEINGVNSTISELLKTSAFKEHTIYTFTPSHADPNIWILRRNGSALESHRLIFFKNRYCGLIDFLNRLLLQPSSFIKYFQLLRRHKIDIVHHHFLSHHGYLIKPVSQWAGARLYLSLHGSDIFRPINSWIYSLSRRAFKASDHVFACADVLKSAALKAYPSWLNRLETIHHGVTIPPLTGPRRLNQSAESPTRIISIGRLDRVKGFDLLIEAVEHMLASNSHRKFSIHIIGDGPERSALEQLIHSKRLSGYIELKGQYTKDEVLKALPDADVYVQPSRSEALSISILESMARGRAIVASDVGGTKELIEDGVSGLLTKPEKPEQLAEKIIQLLENERLRRKLGENAFNRARAKFTWAQASQKYIQSYEDILK